MRNLPVHWSEGLFLLPHHFQAADRFWAESLHSSETLDHEYNYGLRACDLSLAAIANHQFQLNGCRARMKDGTLLDFQPGQEPDRLELRRAVHEVEELAERLEASLQQAFQQQSVVRVYLAVPRYNPATGNVGASDGADGGGHELHRFRECTVICQDDGNGGNDQEIRARTLNVRLLLSTQELTNFELLPVAQIRRGDEGTPALDEEYIPPLLAIDAWPPLHRGIIQTIYDWIGSRLDRLAEDLASRNIGFSSQDPDDLDRLHGVHVLNEAYASLGAWAFAQGIHPFTAYSELCRIVGRLSIFGAKRRVPELPRYDHDDLATVFRKLRDLIRGLLDAIGRDLPYVRRFFVGYAGEQGQAPGLEVKLESDWLRADWKWYVGVSFQHVTEQACRELLAPNQLHWKLGSKPRVEMLFQTRTPGLQLLPLDRPPRTLPHAGSWLYFEVSRESEAWKDVQTTETLAMRFRDTLVINRGELEGHRTLVVPYKGKRAELQFALFAVRTL